MRMDAGSTPQCNSVPVPMSSGIRPWTFSGGGSDASPSWKSFEGMTCAPAQVLASTSTDNQNLRRTVAFLAARGVEAGLWIGLESGAAWAPERGRRMHLAAFMVPRIARAHAASQVAVAVVMPRNEARKLRQRHLVHTALEFDHDVQRNPVVVP